MKTAKKGFVPEIPIYDAKGDLTKQRFVWWKDPLGKRHRKYGKINQFDSPASRLQEAHRLIVELHEIYPIWMTLY